MGIHLKNVGQSFYIFGLEITYYGVLIGLGMLCGVFIAVTEAKRTKQNPDHYYDLAMFGIVISVIGARIYYVVFQWEAYKDHLVSIFNIREGGLAIYGGIIAATLTMIGYAKIKGVNLFQVFDTVAPALLMGQIIGRLGNFFNREVFGEYTNSIFAMQLPLDRVRYSDTTELMREHLVNIGGIDFIQVHPTFLYEIMWNVVLFGFIWWYRKHKKFEGQLFLLYLLGYGLGRIWIEGVRTDQLQLPGLGWPVSQMLSGILILVTGVILIWKWKRDKALKKEQ